VPRDPIVYTRTDALISSCERYRYSLTREWTEEENAPYLLFVCLNPSKADGRFDDPSLKKMARFAHDRGYRSLRVANLFGWRATDPKELAAVVKRSVLEAVGPVNDLTLEMLAEGAADVCCGWGAHGSKWPNRAGAVVELLLKAHGRSLLCLRRTKEGQPLHPLYCPYGTPMQPFKEPVHA
jgi:hypothetical protein